MAYCAASALGGELREGRRCQYRYLSVLPRASTVGSGRPGEPAVARSAHETRRHLKVRVLIADDNRLMLEGFRRALESVEDIEIVGATHAGAHVLSLIERRRPEVVVIELGMRTADGDSCLDAIHQAHPEVKIVVLSASPSELVIRSALSRGARAFITKAVNPLDIPSA